MKARVNFTIVLGLVFWFLAAMPTGHSYLETAPGTAEDVFFAPPATVHNYEDPWDLHNVVTNVLAVTELEIIRGGDGLVAFIFRSDYRPLEHLADFVQFSFYRIPQVRPVKRIGQLADALQIRQLALSDVRLFASVTPGPRGGGISPMMLVRVFKLIAWVEDVVNDMDQLMLYPIQKTVSHFKERPVRMRLLGYPADGMRYVRLNLYSFLHRVSNALTRTGSAVISAGESLRNKVRRYRLMKKHGNYLVYVRMPSEVYHEHRSYLDGAIEKTYRAAGTDTLLFSVKMHKWQKIPHELWRYVITKEELPTFLA